MEDFVLLSIHDLQLPESFKRVNKKEIVAYVFLGDKCLDCLVLGSNAAQLQDYDDNQQSSQAAGAAQLHNPTAKKVKISMFDLKKRIQIVIKKLGDDDSKRFGSVSISLQKLHKSGLNNTFLHWVTLFDALDDDIFDGQLGEDDYEIPRILIEYSVVGNQFTSVMQGMDKLKGRIQSNQLLQEESGGAMLQNQNPNLQRNNLRDQKGNHDQSQLDDDDSSYLEEQRKRHQPKLIDFTLTVEYVESRADKLRGRNKFQARIVENDGIQKEMTAEELERIKRIEFEKEQELQQLDTLCQKFSIKRFKDKVRGKLEGALQDLEKSVQDFNEKEKQYLDFLDKMMKDHHRNVDKSVQQDVYLMALEMYKQHLIQLEDDDITALNRQQEELKRLKEDLILDLEEEQTREEALLGEREELWMGEPHVGVKSQRDQLIGLIKEIDDLRETYRMMQDGRAGDTQEANNDSPDGDEESQDDKIEIDLDDSDADSTKRYKSKKGKNQMRQSISVASSSDQHEETFEGEQFNEDKKAFMNEIIKEEGRKLAADMFKGCDDLYKAHMDSIKEMFNLTRGLQAQREKLLKEMGVLAQMYRDSQIKNVYLMEKIDQQVDKIFETKQHIEYLRKDMIVARKRQLNYMNQLHDLYKSKDNEIEGLTMALERAEKEKDIIQSRRDAAFNTLLELLAERRQVLNMVQENADLLGMNYLNAKSNINQTRLEAHDIMEQSLKVWSTKLNLKGLNSNDPDARKDAEYKLNQMINELEIKQKQLLKLLQSKDQAEGKHWLFIKKRELQGRMEEAIELLTLFVKEAKEDTKDLKVTLKESLQELDEAESHIKAQDRELVKLRRQFTEQDNQLRALNIQYSKINPKATKNQEQNLDQELQELKRQVKLRENLTAKALSEADKLFKTNRRQSDQIKSLVNRELMRNGLADDDSLLSHIQGDIYRVRGLQGILRITLNSDGILEAHIVGVAPNGQKVTSVLPFSEFLGSLQ